MVVNLAGNRWQQWNSIGDRAHLSVVNASAKEKFETSRISTAAVCRAFAVEREEAGNPLKCFIQGSSHWYYHANVETQVLLFFVGFFYVFELNFSNKSRRFSLNFIKKRIINKNISKNNRKTLKNHASKIEKTKDNIWNEEDKGGKQGLFSVLCHDIESAAELPQDSATRQGRVRHSKSLLEKS